MGETDQPILRIEGVSKSFGSVRAVDGVTLDIRKGEIFCLLGGSGSGKTTLLRMLAGFQEPTTGRIEIDGQDMARTPANARPTNMMFQSYALFPHMNVARNVGYGLRRDGVSRAETANRVEEMLALVQLHGLDKRRPDQLSGGQRQRVALARALIKRPKLLLLDEPLGALDKKLREQTQFELMSLQERLGITFVVVTHDQEEAMSIGSRIGIMDQGRIVQVGKPRQVYEYPNSRFTAEFIGSVNMLEGKVVRDAADQTGLACPDLGQEIHIGHGVPCRLNQTLWYALRPEKLRLSKARPEHARNVVEGLVEEIAYMGGASVYRVALNGGRRLLVTRFNTERASDDDISWDERVHVYWDDTAGVALTA